MLWSSLLRAMGAGLVFMVATSAQAVVYDTSVSLGDYSDSRSVDSGSLVISSGGGFEDASIEWVVSDLGNGFLKYVYKLLNFPNGPQDSGGAQVSHFDLDLSNNLVSGGQLIDPDGFKNATIQFGAAGTPQAWAHLAFGNIDGITGAVKFDETGNIGDYDLMIISFESNRMPVWGNFFAKIGSKSITNAGSGNEGMSNDVDDFVARPDSIKTTEMPTPVASLGGAICIGVMALRRRRSSR